MEVLGAAARVGGGETNAIGDFYLYSSRVGRLGMGEGHGGYYFFFFFVQPGSRDTVGIKFFFFVQPGPKRRRFGQVIKKKFLGQNDAVLPLF